MPNKAHPALCGPVRPCRSGSAGLTIVLMPVLALGLSACSGMRLPSLSRSARPPAAVAVAAERLPAIVDSGYELGPEDALDIAVWKDEALKREVLVRPDGGISFPLVGDLKVAGMTAAQVQAELVRRLEKFMPEPVVTVAVIKVASYRIYVLGRVNKPGDFAAGRPVDVLQALSMAGGMTPFAAEDDIRIIRKVGNQQTAIPFQYSRVRKGEALAQNIVLKTGDVVLVP